MSKLGTYDSVLATEYMLAKALNKQITLNVTKSQKLLFIIYGYFLSEHNHEIFTEKPKAWPYGPVFPRSQKKVDYSKWYLLESFDKDPISKDVIFNTVLDEILERYSGFSASQLSEWSHMEGSPWYITTKLPNFTWNIEIDNNLISNYFKSVNVR